MEQFTWTLEEFQKIYPISKNIKQYKEDWYSKIVVHLYDTKVSFANVHRIYFPDAGKPSHVIFLHDKGSIVIHYHCIECIERFKKNEKGEDVYCLFD